MLLAPLHLAAERDDAAPATARGSGRDRRSPPAVPRGAPILADVDASQPMRSARSAAAAGAGPVISVDCERSRLAAGG